MKINNLLFFLLITLLVSCNQKQSKEPIVVITTKYGNIKVKLYNETPLHRDNFLTLVKQGYFNNKIFERVIKNFMIQGGSSSSQTTNDPHPESAYKYKIQSEIDTKFFHKKGALAAARYSDEENPNRESTPTQFYIVHGDIYQDSTLNLIEESINNQNISNLATINYLIEAKKLKENNQSFDKKELYQNSLSKAKSEINNEPFKFTEEQRKFYKTTGGAPHLDNLYTIFGEVTEGLNIVDSIANAETSTGDRPVEDIKFTMKVQE